MSNNTEQRYTTRSGACGVRFPMKGRWVVCLLAAAMVLSCQKAGTQLPGGEIVLCVEDGGVQASVDTKATPVTAIPSSLYWGATTGGNAAGSTSETVKWATASKSMTNGMISTGKYLPATPSAINYYVANQVFTAGGSMTVANNSVDIICGRTFGTTLQMPVVALNHIFARTGTLALSVPAGYTATSVSWRIKSKGAVSGTAGTYDMKSQSWTAASTALSDQAFTGSSDLWVIPGTYTVTVSFTLTKGAFTKAYTQAGDVTLVAGKQNNITATTNNDEAAQVSFGVSLSAWSNNQTDLTAADFHISEPEAVDLGGTSTVLYAAWNLGASSETDYGDYYAWAETSKRYTNTAASLQNNDNVTLTGTPFATDWSNTPYHIGTNYSTGWTKYIPTSQASFWGGEGSPDNKTTLDPSDDVAHLQWGGDWRMPTSSELEWLVNSSNCNWSWQSDYNGSGVNGYLVTSKHNSASLFLPCAGFCSGSNRYSAGTNGYYWSSSLYTSNPHSTYRLYFRGNPYERNIDNIISRYFSLSVRAVKPKS